MKKQTRLSLTPDTPRACRPREFNLWKSQQIATGFVGPRWRRVPFHAGFLINKNNHRNPRGIRIRDIAFVSPRRGKSVRIGPLLLLSSSSVPRFTHTDRDLLSILAIDAHSCSFSGKRRSATFVGDPTQRGRETTSGIEPRNDVSMSLGILALPSVLNYSHAYARNRVRVAYNGEYETQMERPRRASAESRLVTGFQPRGGLAEASITSTRVFGTSCATRRDLSRAFPEMKASPSGRRERRLIARTN